MPYQLQKDESVDAGLKRIAEEQLAGAIRDLRGAEDLEKGIYEARKRIKKVRAAMRLIEPQLGPIYQEENRRLRDVARRFAALRDSRVSLDILEQFAKQYKRSNVLDAQRESLVAKRAAMKEAAELRASLAESIEILMAMRKRVEDWPLRHVSGERLQAEIKRTHKQGRHALERAASSRSAEDFHELRKLVKRELNQRRLFEAEEPAELKRLSSLLGDHHDLAVLILNVDEPSARFLQMVRRQMLGIEGEVMGVAGMVYAGKAKAAVA